MTGADQPKQAASSESGHERHRSAPFGADFDHFGKNGQGSQEQTMISDSHPSAIDLSAGPIDYIDTGGNGPTVVLIHGVLMNQTVWRDVITELAPAFRCLAPTLPLGAHRQPMRPRADLSIDGIALLVAEFLERLDLHDVTLIMNDWGGPQLLVDHDRTERISRLADLLPDGRMVELTDSYTVVPRDQPQQLAEAVRAFITSTAARPR
jgi:hypothetical protein